MHVISIFAFLAGYKIEKWLQMRSLALTSYKQFIHNDLNLTCSTIFLGKKMNWIMITV